MLRTAMSEAGQLEIQVSRRVRSALAQAVDETRIAGGVVLVALDGDVIAQEAAGFANQALAIPMHIDTRFRLASVTKPIISLAAMKLLEIGVLGLHEPVSHWLPYFRPSLADGRRPEITLHHLLSHSSGLSYGFQEPPGSEYERFGISDGLDCSGLSLEENLRRLAAAKLKFEPGTAWQYSLALDVVGAIIERATGCTLPDAIDALISGPLGLDSLAFTVQSEFELAVPYVDSLQTLTVMPEPAEVVPPEGTNAIRFSPCRAHTVGEFPSGGAGMIGGASDILKVLEIVRKKGAAFIDAKLARLMRSAHVGADLRAQGDGWGFGYMGAVLMAPSVLNTPQRVGTIGWGGVYGHSWFFDPAAGLTVVSLTNTTWEGVGGRFPQDVRDAVYAALS
jgi:CubicO group peptidase (beta-lactamase class C family)